MAGFVGLGLVWMLAVDAVAAEPFIKLSVAQIRLIFVGMDFTDDVHWAVQHFRDGSVKSFHMGRAASGKWRLDGDVLCVDYVKGQTECHEIWRSRKIYQQRREDGSVYLWGELVKHEKRG